MEWGTEGQPCGVGQEDEGCRAGYNGPSFVPAQPWSDRLGQCLMGGNDVSIRLLEVRGHANIVPLFCLCDDCKAALQALPSCGEMGKSLMTTKATY